MSVLRSHNNKTRGGLGRVCATGMHRSTEHVNFPKFQTGIFVEWKAPQETDPQETVARALVRMSCGFCALSWRKSGANRHNEWFGR